MQRLLTTKEVAEYLRLRKETVLRKAERGMLPAIKVDGRWRFPEDQIEQWLKGKEQAVTAKPTAMKKPIRLKTYHLGVVSGTLSRREIYEGL